MVHESVRRDGAADADQRDHRGGSARRRPELLAIAGPVAGTRGRALDHIGFEVRNLEEFCKKLEAQGIKLDVPFRAVPALNITLAFITDPWGTYIELNEGLGNIK